MTFKLIAISDIHLGHRKTPTKGIIANLRKVINIETLMTVDMVIIAGDLLDHAIGYSDDDTIDIQKWLVWFLCQCVTYNVSVRILEGTPLHDRRQSRHIEVLNKSSKLEVDLLYVDKVWIEKNKKYNIDILYVPDEWKPDTDQTWVDVMNELSDNSLESVDLSVMHGMFEHQLPPGCPIKPHSLSLIHI